MGGEKGVRHLPCKCLDAKLDGEDVESKDDDPEVEVHTRGEKALTHWVEEEGKSGKAGAGGEHTEEEEQPDSHVDEEPGHQKVGHEAEQVDGHGEVVAGEVFSALAWRINFVGSSAVFWSKYLQQELLGKGEPGKMLKTRDTEDEHKGLIDFRTSERNLEQVLRSLDPPVPVTSASSILFCRLQSPLPLKKDRALWSNNHAKQSKEGEGAGDDRNNPEVGESEGSGNQEDPKDED